MRRSGMGVRLMIEYLEKLVQEEEYRKALAYAEQLLLHPENSPPDLMRISLCLLRARFELGDFDGARVAGQLAARMARELEAWDCFGASALWLGLCHDRLREPERALEAWYDYLAYLPYYTEASRYHVIVLFNIGLVSAQAGWPQQGLRMLHKALETACAYGEERKAHGIRHALIDAHLRHGDLDAIPSLLAQCARYLRRNPGADDHARSLRWHYVLRVRYALATRRPMQALAVASRGLCMTEDPNLRFHFRMLLARAYAMLDDYRAALGEATQARGIASAARRYDLEYEATTYIYELVSAHSGWMGGSIRPEGGRAVDEEGADPAGDVARSLSGGHAPGGGRL